MPSKKGSKYLNAKTYSVLSKYTPEDIQKLLNSGQFKSVIARTLGVAACFRNESGSLSSVKTGQPIKIAAYMQPRFKAGTKLKEACNKNEKSKKQ